MAEIKLPEPLNTKGDLPKYQIKYITKPIAVNPQDQN